MDADEFQRMLQMFPVVRSRDSRLDSGPSTQSPSRPVQDEVHKWQDAWENPPDENHKGVDDEAASDLHDAFWEKLKSVAEKKVIAMNLGKLSAVGPADAQRFCDAFQQVHRQLVYNELSLDTAWSLINSIGSSG